MEICDNCKEHIATTKWVGDGGTLALSHGWYSWWCECCMLKAQIQHAKERAAVILDLERQLLECLCEVLP